MDLRTMQRAAHDNAVAHGFVSDDGDEHVIPRSLMLIVTEVAEAMEAYRDYGFNVDDERTIMDVVEKAQNDGATADCKPEGMASELADVIIRVGDLAEHLGIDLDRAVTLKMAYNASRPYRHGGKRA